MDSPLSQLEPEEKSRLERRESPTWISPMLATLSREIVEGEEWIYERKLDGERALAFCEGSSVRLLSRNRNDLLATYPELTEALAGRELSGAVLDGEIVTFQDNRTSFERLQEPMQLENPDEAARSRTPVWYYVFDLRSLPLVRRTLWLRRDKSPREVTGEG